MVTITPNQQASVSYAAAGGQTMFNASCRAFPGYLSSFVVTVNGAACVYSPVPATNRQFSVVDNGAAVAGIVFGAGLTVGDIVVIRRALPLERQTNLPETGPVSLAALNQELSRLVALVQDALANITIVGDPGIPDGNYGDIIASGAGTALNIGNGRVALSKITNLAASSILGNNTGVPGLPLELTGAQVTALLALAIGDTGAGGTKGLVPAPAAGDAAAGRYLKADMTWGLPAGGGGGGGVTSSSLTFKSDGTGAAANSTFDGSVGRILSWNSIGAAPLNSPNLTGTPLAPTAALGTNTTQIATTAFVKAALDALINAAPGTMDTLKELADALGDDPNYAATTAAAIAAKAPARPTVAAVGASFSAVDADNNSHKVLSGAAQTLTLPNITAGTSFTVRATTAWSITCAGGLSKNGANPAAVTTGTISAGSIITFLHEGAGVWVATGSGLA